MTDPVVPVAQVLPFPVRIVRWWEKSTIRMQLWSFIELAVPILLLTDFGALGFSTKTAAWLMILIKLVNVAMQIRASVASSDVVGNKQEVAVADAAPSPTVATPEQVAGI